MARLATVYGTLGVPERLEHDVFEGGHRWNGDRAYEFLDHWLGTVPGKRSRSGSGGGCLI